MWIKICGVRDSRTAAAIAALAPDAIGLNFYAKSPRHVKISAAVGIVAELPVDVEAVGVFVDESAETIVDNCQKCSLETVQLHGSESPKSIEELVSRLDECRIIRAWNLGPEGLAALDAHLSQLRELDVVPAACLIDARVPGQHGGTGHTVDWELLNREYNREKWPPLILAGGLTPENVAEAIHTARPWGVDVASGVESARGVKDISLVARFIQEAREAFGAVEP